MTFLCLKGSDVFCIFMIFSGLQILTLLCAQNQYHQLSLITLEVSLIRVKTSSGERRVCRNIFKRQILNAYCMGPRIKQSSSKTPSLSKSLVFSGNSLLRRRYSEDTGNLTQDILEQRSHLLQLSWTAARFGSHFFPSLLHSQSFHQSPFWFPCS